MPSHLTTVLKLLGLKLDPPQVKAPIVSEDYQRTLAQLLGRRGSFAVPILATPHGALCSVPYDLGLATAHTEFNGTVAPTGSNTLSFGGLYHLHNVSLEAGTPEIRFTIDGTNYDHYWYGDGGHFGDSAAAGNPAAYVIFARSWGCKLRNDHGSVTMSYRWVSYQFAEPD